MKMLTGFLTPTSGTAVVCGHDIISDAIEVKKVIGYLPEGAPAYPDMTPEAFLRFVAEVRGYRGQERRRRIDEVAAAVHLEGVMRQPIETLSKGYRRRVGLAQALIHDPDVLIMDEPTDGLDPNQKHEVRALIAEMADRKAIVLSTHILEEVEAVCSRAIIISRGRIVADGTPADLQGRSRHRGAIRLAVRVGADELHRELTSLSDVASVEPLEADDGLTRCMVFPRNGKAIVSAVSQHVGGKGWEIDELQVEEGRLDDVFREVTTSGLVAAADDGKESAS
jgi:ABC-2 type transport system ATP-binding protein